MNAPAPDEVSDGERNGPFEPDDHVARTFNQLPRNTREWLSNLREEDIEEIEDAREWLRDFKTVGRVGRWFILGVVAAFAGLLTVTQGWGVIKGWFK